MIKSLALIVFYFHCAVVMAQPNCEAYKLSGHLKKYEACKKVVEALKINQFSKEFQQMCDEAIVIDSTYAYAYREKSTAYLKSGDFSTWMKLMNKAVAYDPKENLNYRGWCRFQFFRDYKGAIADIEQFDRIVTYDIGYSQNGTYHLNIAKGLCYKGLGDNDKAIAILENQIKKNEEIDFVGALDYLHLGVLYYEQENFDKALILFEKQILINNLSEVMYYLALTYKSLNNVEKCSYYLSLAKKLYLNNQTMSDPYSTPMDKIFLSDIDIELAKL
jgi:tetratricopeptide (TPR) repeat protein